MPMLKHSVPKYRKHIASGQAVLLNGKDFYLGPHGSKKSINEYDRLVGEWLANGRRPREPDEHQGITVNEACAAYWRHAKAYYGDTGKRRGTANNMKPVLKLLCRLYLLRPAAWYCFSPRESKQMRREMADRVRNTPLSCGLWPATGLADEVPAAQPVDGKVQWVYDYREGQRLSEETRRPLR